MPADLEYLRSILAWNPDQKRAPRVPRALLEREELPHATVSSPRGYQLPPVDTDLIEGLVTTIFYPPRRRSPQELSYPVAAQQRPVEIVNKLSYATEIARIRKIFEDYDPTADTKRGKKLPQETTVLNPAVAYNFNEHYGSKIPDNAQLFRLMTEKGSGPTFRLLDKKVKTTLAIIVHGVSRIPLENPITTVGTLRTADIESILAAASKNSHLTPRSLIFAQFAFRK